MLSERSTRLWLAFFALLLCCSSAQTQTTVAPPRPTLVEDVNEVRVDITVRDKHGRPVLDLTPQDVHITDDGKPVVLRAFRLADRNSSNELRTVSILLDTNEPDSGRTAYRATSALIKTLAATKTYYSAWQIQDRLAGISDFTSDTARFEEALRLATIEASKRAKREATHASDASRNGVGSERLPPPLQGISVEAATRAANLVQQNHLKPWLACISALVSEQAKIAGRKLIVFFSSGVANQEGVTEALRPVISEANRSNTSIYVVDVSGLSARLNAEAASALPAMGFGAANLASMKAAGYTPPPPTGPGRLISAPMRSGQFDNIGAQPDFERNEPLRRLAGDTGGFYIAESANLRAAMSKVAEDAQTYYEAVYVPAPEPADGHFRPVSLRVERPHVVARTRSGYDWTPAADGWKVAPFEIPLIKALDSPSVYNSIPIEAKVLRYGTQGPNTTAALVVQFPFEALTSRSYANEKLTKFHFAMVALIRTSDGKIVQKLSQDAPYETAIEKTKEIKSQLFTFQRRFELPPGDYWAELAVEDENSSAIGTQRVPFSIASPQLKPVADRATDLPAIEAPGPAHLLASKAPKLESGVQPPDEKEISEVLSGAKARAMDFQTGLPNFLCLLRTERFYDRTGKGNWKRHDSITELVGYTSGREQYSTLEVNGEHVTADRSKLGGVRANGVFGQLLAAVFSERAAATFKWQGKSEINGAPVHVFAYSAPRSRSGYDLKSEDGTRTATVGFHGLVYIDAATFAVRHVSLEADNIPKDLPWRESVIDVDYDYVKIGDQEFLLPLSAELRLRKGKAMLYKNEMQFRDYRRFMASSRVLP